MRIVGAERRRRHRHRLLAPRSRRAAPVSCTATTPTWHCDGDRRDHRDAFRFPPVRRLSGRRTGTRSSKDTGRAECNQHRRGLTRRIPPPRTHRRHPGRGGIRPCRGAERSKLAQRVAEGPARALQAIRPRRQRTCAVAARRGIDAVNSSTGSRTALANQYRLSIDVLPAKRESLQRSLDYCISRTLPEARRSVRAARQVPHEPHRPTLPNSIPMATDLIPFVTAGDPLPGAQVALMHALVEAGADYDRARRAVLRSDGRRPRDPTRQRACDRQSRPEAECSPGCAISRSATPRRRSFAMGYLNPGRDPWCLASRAGGRTGVDNVLLVDLSGRVRHPPRRCATPACNGSLLAAPTTTDDERLGRVCGPPGVSAALSYGRHHRRRPNQPRRRVHRTSRRSSTDAGRRSRSASACRMRRRPRRRRISPYGRDRQCAGRPARGSGCERRLRACAGLPRTDPCGAGYAVGEGSRHRARRAHGQRSRAAGVAPGSG